MTAEFGFSWACSSFLRVKKQQSQGLLVFLVLICLIFSARELQWEVTSSATWLRNLELSTRTMERGIFIFSTSCWRGETKICSAGWGWSATPRSTRTSSRSVGAWAAPAAIVGMENAAWAEDILTKNKGWLKALHSFSQFTVTPHSGVWFIWGFDQRSHAQS